MTELIYTRLVLSCAYISLNTKLQSCHRSLETETRSLVEVK